MVDENEMVLTRWSARNKKWYEEKGYPYTGMHTEFYVRLGDLTPGSHSIIHMTCDYCGKVLEMKYNTYRIKHEQSPIDSCNQCKGNKIRSSTLKIRADISWSKLESFCNEMGYKLITDKDEYTHSKMDIYYRCSKHGTQHSILNNMTHGHGCAECKYELMAAKARRNPDEVEEIINSQNGNQLLNKEEYQSVFKNNLRIRCSCGNEYTASLRNYMLGQNRCSKCSSSMSYPAWRIYDLLSDAGIDFETEKTFSDLTDVKHLRFDFYLPDYNLIIEYDGEGHYQELFYKNFNEDAKQLLENAQRRDRIKDEYCANHGIHILRIPYWESENIEDIVFDTLNDLEKERNVV